MRRPLAWIAAAVIAGITTVPALVAQSFALPSADLADSTALAGSMPRLASRVMVADTNPNRDRLLDDRFRLQIVQARYQDAARTLAELRALREARPGAAPELRAANVQYEMDVEAKLLEAGGQPFPEALARVFRARFARLDDRTAALVARALSVDQAALDADLARVVVGQQGHAAISLADALTLLRKYQVAKSYRDFAALVSPLVAEDDRRRYAVERNLRIPTPDGATLCAMLVRPRTAPPRLPAVLRFTIYADSATDLREARRTASHQYASVTGYTRGKMCSPGRPWPYVHDADDVATTIQWISRQPWSDGRVAMYSGSYEGFTQWAAAKRMPKALKAIMTGAAAAPGLDAPMEGNIVWNFQYPWPFYAAANKTLDTATYNNVARWRKLNREWYVSGRAYRDLDRIDGTPNPVFDEWISHPAYDAYWQSVIPYRKEFASIDIPVLQTAGYYYGGPGAALYYFTQHYRYNPRAEHYLVIGPYDHFQGQRGVVDALGDTATSLAGYEIDPVARIDIVADLRYQWLDYVLRHGPKPALLQDKVNYEVTGANVWRHAPSIKAMSNGTLRFYLSGTRDGDHRTLSPRRPVGGDTAVTLTVDLKDRSDVDRNVPGGGVLDTAIDTSNGIAFVSDPLASPEVSGLYGGRLELVTNKKDFDFSVSLYELRPDGRYMQIPPYQSRASFVEDVGRRRLLTPGKRERLVFTSVRLASCRFQPGSRLVLVLGVIKNPGQQINYGTGKDVNAETIADAGEPLTIQWLAGSYIDLPVRR
jgi:uncharacterized protein